MKREADVNCSRAILVTNYSSAFLVRNGGQQTLASGTVSASELSEGADKCIAWLVFCIDTSAKLFGGLLARIYRCFDRSVV
jgi:hypothetical protein